MFAGLNVWLSSRAYLLVHLFVGLCKKTQVRAMVLADRTLFLVRPADVVDEAKSLRDFDSSANQSKLVEQRELLDGKSGSFLWVASADDGAKLAEYRLDGMPVFDGLAAANGRLYLATTDDKVVCFAVDE